MSRPDLPVIPGIVAAYRAALRPDGIAFATPQAALVAALLLAYGGGIALVAGRLDSVTTIAVAVVLATASVLVGIGVGWGRSDHGPPRPVASTPWLARAGLLLVAAGLVAMVAYLVRIGEIPLFMAAAEQGRVDAAERGGAPLRVLSLLALPGAWLLVAAAVTTPGRRRLAFAIAVIAVVAMLQALTANRSHAFQTVIVALLVALLAGGRQRLRRQGLAVIIGLAVVAVVAAGAFGAFRLASGLPSSPPPVGSGEDPPRDLLGLTLVAIRGYAVVPAQNFAYTLEAVPDHIDWRFGLTYLQPALTVLPGHQPTFDQELKMALGQTYLGGGTVPSMLGEAYANFGPLGWILVPLLLGAVLSRLYRLAHRRGAAALWTLYAYAIFHACGAMLSGLSVASIFPMQAYAILGMIALAEWAGWRSRPAVSPVERRAAAG